jgi:hypothetical protein
LTEREPIFKYFFEIEPRKVIPNQQKTLIDLVDNSFEHLFTHYKALLFQNLNSFTEHNLYIKVKERNIDEEKEAKTADEAFAKYICDVFKQTNMEYFLFVTKFVILFRECINKYRALENGDEYMKVSTAETVPDLCNEFITEFMEGNDYFGLDTNELIEIIQQFCHWLYENKYTTSRLTLVS